MGVFKKKSQTTDVVLKQSDSSSTVDMDDMDVSAQLAMDQEIRIPSLEGLPTLIATLETNKHNLLSTKLIKTLGKLFTLSEHDSSTENRIRMARDPALVPLLLEVLQGYMSTPTTKQGSKDQQSPQQASQSFTLALLVLNNLCIPMQTKRLLAIEYQVVETMCQLLLHDVSCHLIAILLVNLTLSCGSLRVELLKQNVQLMESLVLALRVGCMTGDEFDKYQVIRKKMKPHASATQLLKSLAADDEKQQGTDDSTEFGSSSILLPPSSQFVYPETVRWSLTALKNLSRPSSDSTAALALISSPVAISLMLELVKVDDGIVRQQSSGQSESTSSASCDDTGLLSDPDEACQEQQCIDTANSSPSTWESHSAQDTTLLILMNLAATPATREYIYNSGAIDVLRGVANYQPQPTAKLDALQEELLVYHRVKARMALAYLIASKGFFGQPEASLPSSASYDTTVLLVTESEATKILQIFSDTLHRRPDKGYSGYSAHTFSVKFVLLAIRCLLTQYTNQELFAQTHGTELNALLMKVLAQHTLLNAVYVDAEAAEYASFSVYLLSNHCFDVFADSVPFLPSSFEGNRTPRHGFVNVADSQATKILTAYSQRHDTLPAGKHAAEQLLKRLDYLSFEGSSRELAKASRSSSAVASDYTLDKTLGELVNMMVVDAPEAGARPDPNIFNRPLLHRSALTMMMTATSKKKKKNKELPLEEQESVKTFANALQAAQDLSFGSTKVRHLEAIDDVLIANNIVHSALGEKMESYNCIWSWRDQVEDIQRQLIHNTVTACAGPEPILPSTTCLWDALFGAFYQ